MRVQILTLKNFRSHRNTVLELDRFNFVRGPNGCGKTSIQLALEYLLTGRCELTDAAGRGAEALIRTGEKELEVSATLESGETIYRRRTIRAQVVEINGKRVPMDAAEAFLTKQFGSLDVLSAVLNSSRFVEMSEAEQKRFLAQVLDAGKVDLPSEILEAIRAINEEPPILASVSDFQAPYKRFHDLRIEAMQALNALGQVEKPDIPADLPGVQEVKNKIEELRHQKERLVAQKAETQSKWEAAQARLKQVQAEIESLSPEILSPSQEQELRRLESQAGHADKLRQELADLTAQQKAAEAALVVAQGLKGRCPTCGHAVGEEGKAKEIRRLQERLADLKGLIQAARGELNDFAGIETARSRLEVHREALARRVALEDERSKLLRVQRPDVGGTDSRIAILAERINKGERVLEKARQFDVARERWEAYLGDKSSWEKRISILERLTAFFGPEGAMMEQARTRMASFEDELNRRLAVFGYNWNLTLEPFEIRVISSSRGGPSLSFRQLSESERFRFSIAFQLALATTTGIRFVVIDRADVFDKERRRLLTVLLSNSDVEQAILLATSEETLPSVVPPGVRFLSLEEGMRRGQVVASTAA